MDFFRQLYEEYIKRCRRPKPHLGRIDIGAFRHHHHFHLWFSEERKQYMSVSPPTQPIFTVGVQYFAPLSFTDTTGAPFPLTGLSNVGATADNANVTTQIESSGAALLASIGAAGVTSVITVSATDSYGTVITATVTVSDATVSPPPPPPAPHLASISIGTFVPVSTPPAT